MICDTVILCRVTLPLPGHRVQKLSFYLLNHDLDTIVNVNSFRGRLSAQLTAIEGVPQGRRDGRATEGLNASRGVWFVEPLVVGAVFAHHDEVHKECGALFNMVVIATVIDFIEGAFASRMGVAEGEVVAGA